MDGIKMNILSLLWSGPGFYFCGEILPLGDQKKRAANCGKGLSGEQNAF